MTSGVPRGIAVVDIGATNSKVVLFDVGLQEIARRKTDTVHHEGPPYRHVDAQRIVEFAVGAISELDRVLPVDVIVVSAFGSTLGCVDEAGELVMPIMDYLAEPPAEIVAGYANIAPPFAETFCNTWPAALSLGRQLFWLETAFPGPFARVRSIMTWSQYLAFRLGGRKTCEVTALGAFSQLLDVLKGEFSSVVHRRGWGDRFAPLTRAELPDLTITISVLSPMAAIPCESERELIDQLRPDRDGLLLREGRAAALFLPSVWREVPSPVDFVRFLKRKMGVAPSHWSPTLTAERFSVESFGSPYVAPGEVDLEGIAVGAFD